MSLYDTEPPDEPVPTLEIVGMALCWAIGIGIAGAIGFSRWYRVYCRRCMRHYRS